MDAGIAGTPARSEGIGHWKGPGSGAPSSADGHLDPPTRSSDSYGLEAADGGRGYLQQAAAIVLSMAGRS
jgi:hypothetical protein